MAPRETARSAWWNKSRSPAAAAAAAPAAAWLSSACERYELSKGCSPTARSAVLLGELSAGAEMHLICHSPGVSRATMPEDSPCWPHGLRCTHRRFRGRDALRGDGRFGAAAVAAAAASSAAAAAAADSLLPPTAASAFRRAPSAFRCCLSSRGVSRGGAPLETPAGATPAWPSWSWIVSPCGGGMQQVRPAGLGI